jgi:hypothetical protein
VCSDISSIYITLISSYDWLIIKKEYSTVRNLLAKYRLKIIYSSLNIYFIPKKTRTDKSHLKEKREHLTLSHGTTVTIKMK